MVTPVGTQISSWLGAAVEGALVLPATLCSLGHSLWGTAGPVELYFLGDMAA